MYDYADEIVAALVVCLAAVYAMRLIWDWRGAQKLRHELELLNAQGRQILTVIGQPGRKGLHWRREDRPKP